MAELMQGFAILRGQTHALAIASDGEGGWRLPDSHQPIALTAEGLKMGGRLIPLSLVRQDARLWIHLGGETYELNWRSPVDHFADEAAGASDDVARAPMPGMVVATMATSGAVVAAGDTLLIIESMKLETAIKAPRNGVVHEVHVRDGDRFERDALLVSLVSEA